MSNDKVYFIFSSPGTVFQSVNNLSTAYYSSAVMFGRTVLQVSEIRGLIVDPE